MVRHLTKVGFIPRRLNLIYTSRDLFCVDVLMEWIASDRSGLYQDVQKMYVRHVIFKFVFYLFLPSHPSSSLLLFIPPPLLQSTTSCNTGKQTTSSSQPVRTSSQPVRTPQSTTITTSQQSTVATPPQSTVTTHDTESVQPAPVMQPRPGV